MPSFFESLKRLAQGKPIFTPEESTGTHSSGSPSQDPAAATAGEQKIRPSVTIEDTKSSTNGSRMECYSFIHNSSPYEITLDKINVLGQWREIDATLRTGEKREFLVYSGSIPEHQNNHDADLQFRDDTGDYFMSHHDVFFDPEDGGYTIRKFQFSGLRNM